MISRSTIRVGLGGVGLALLLIGPTALAESYRVKTARGTYLVEVEVADIAVSGDGDDLVIKPAKGDEIRLRLDSDRTDRTSKEPFFALRRDGKMIVSARRISSGTDSPVDEVPGRSVLGGGATPRAWSLAITPDGRTLVSGHHGSVRVWDLPILAERFNVPVAKTVRRVGVTADGATIASVEYGNIDGKTMGSVVIRDGKTGEPRRAMEPVEAMHAVAIDPLGKLAASSTWGGSSEVMLWDVEKGEKVRSVDGNSGYVGAVAFSPDGKTLANGGDSSVRLWDAASGRAGLTLRGPTKPVESLAFSGDGKRIVAGGFDRKGRVWDVATGKLLATLECDEPVLAAAISDDGKLAATAAARWGNGSFDPAPAEVQVWDVATGQAVLTLPEHPSQVFAMAFTPDAKSLVTGSLAGTLAVWELAKFREEKGAEKAEKP